MTRWKLYYNPQCSKCRQALELLKSKSIDFEGIEYLKNPPSIEDLKVIASQLVDPISALVRVKEEDFINAPFDVSSVDEVVHQLAKKPHLMERPILQGNGQAVIGRPVDKLLPFLTK